MTTSRWYQSWRAKTISSFGLDPAHHLRRTAPTAASTDANEGTWFLEELGCELMWTSVTRVGTRGQDPTGAAENMRRLALIRPRGPRSVTLSSEDWGSLSRL